MQRMFVAVLVAVLLSSGLAYAQLGSGGASGTNPTLQYSVTVHLFSPWLGEDEIAVDVPSETDARLEVEKIFRQGYWHQAVGTQPAIVWPPSSVVWIRVAQVF